MAKSDVLVRMKADTQGYDANIAKARRQLDQFKQDNLTLGGILNQSTKSIVAAAAQYASFAAVIGTVASGFSEAVSRGTEMAREMEGVKMAFDRLNQPGLLDNLREATHNTVNDLELMKQAVKFDNFNLSIEQMGTFLAFAQQQAKDTGQDVNYLVDSIVTGLGRKSLPILDNLGLSAEAIRDKMKETGDMTTAVAEIIQERMEAAGGYVETAADRAAQAQVRLDNAMTELGNTMNSLSGSGATLWTDLKTGAINLANTAIKPLISLFNQLASYVQGTSAEDILTRGMTDVTDTVDDNGRLIRKNAIFSIPEISVVGNKPTTKVRTGKTTRENVSETIRKQYEQAMLKSSAMSDTFKAADINQPSDAFMAFAASVKGATEETLSPLQKLNAELQELRDNLEKAPDTATYQFGLAEIAKKEKEIEEFQGIKRLETDGKKVGNSWGKAASSIAMVGSALNSIEDPTARIAATVAQGIASIVAAYGQALAEDQSSKSNIWLFLATTAATMASMAATISQVHSLSGYAEGGIVGGKSYSGDHVPIMANAGELVLTKAMQGNLASQLAGNGGDYSPSYISGEQIYVTLNRYTRRTGRGEIATFK